MHDILMLAFNSFHNFWIDPDFEFPEPVELYLAHM